MGKQLAEATGGEKNHLRQVPEVNFLLLAFEFYQRDDILKLFTLQYNSIYPEAGYPDRQLSGSAWLFR